MDRGKGKTSILLNELYNSVNKKEKVFMLTPNSQCRIHAREMMHRLHPNCFIEKYIISDVERLRGHLLDGLIIDDFDIFSYPDRIVDTVIRSTSRFLISCSSIPAIQYLTDVVFKNENVTLYDKDDLKDYDIKI